MKPAPGYWENKKTNKMDKSKASLNWKKKLQTNNINNEKEDISIYSRDT